MVIFRNSGEIRSVPLRSPASPLWSAIFDPLTLVTTDGDLLPWLATGWEQTSETTWRITLRTDVLFSNGEPFNAAAVVAAVSYLTSPAGQREPVGRELGNIESAHALEDQTVEIVTHHPDPLLPYKLSMLRPFGAGAVAKANAGCVFRRAHRHRPLPRL